MTHLFFPEHTEHDVEFEEGDEPTWLVSRDFKWWYDDYVKKLPVGGYIDSDFRRFTRIS